MPWYHYYFIIDAQKTGIIKVKKDVVKHDDHRRHMSFGKGEQLAGARQLCFQRVGGSAAWTGSLSSDLKPELNVHAQARSRTDSDLLAIIAVKGEKIGVGILEAQTLSNSLTYKEVLTDCCY